MLCIELREGCDLPFIINMLFARSHKNADQQLMISARGWLGHVKDPQAASAMSLTLPQVSIPCDNFIPFSLVPLPPHTQSKCGCVCGLSPTNHSILKTRVNWRAHTSTVFLVSSPTDTLYRSHQLSAGGAMACISPRSFWQTQSRKLPYIRMTNRLCYRITIITDLPICAAKMQIMYGLTHETERRREVKENLEASLLACQTRNVL